MRYIFLAPTDQCARSAISTLRSAWFDIHDTVVKYNFQSSRLVPADTSMHAYLPHTSTSKTLFRPLSFKVHTDSSYALLTIRILQGSRLDPSRCSSFCSFTKAVPLASGSLIHVSFINLGSGDQLALYLIKVTGVFLGRSKRFDRIAFSQSQIYLLLEIESSDPIRPPTILSAPPLQQSFQG